MYKPLSRLWLLAGVAALAVAGVLALILVAARAPETASPVLSDLFHTALVAHVDLSVLVWFLAVACCLWSVEARGVPRLRIPYLEETALSSFALGALGIALSPFTHASALMSNYIPVIASPVFFLGLMLVACGVSLQLLHYFLHARDVAANAQSLGAFLAALMTLAALACFKWSVILLPRVFDGQQYYDMVFWAGGHALQLLHGQVAIVAWLALACALRPGLKPGAFFYGTYAIGALAALAAGFIMLRYDITSAEFRTLFTNGVMGIGGLAPALAGLWMLRHLSLPSARERALFTSLLMSLLLFFYGGALGEMIRGQNMTIPAHYHGEIVGITLAFMGLTYLWLPRFGYGDVAGTRLATWQPVVLGIGQALHVTGLAWSGGYGVLRKMPGVAGLSPDVKAALGLMGIGGALAIVGGLMFVVAVARAVWDKAA